MRDWTVQINDAMVNKTPLQGGKIVREIVTMTTVLETMLNETDADLNEKLDFLIFMTSKVVGKGQYTVTGNQLFQEWKKAKNQVAKPLPNDEDEGGNMGK